MNFKKVSALICAITTSSVMATEKPSGDDYINILYITDANYAEPTDTAIKADIENSNSGDKYRFIIAYDDSYITQPCYTINAKNTDRFDYRFVDISEIKGIIANLEPYSWPILIYIKMCVDMIVDRMRDENGIYINKVIYKDGDTKAVGDQMQLWTHDLKDKALSACNTGDENNKYYNAGVIVFDTEKFERRNIGNEFRRSMEANQPKINIFTEEHAITNIALNRDEVNDLPLRFNMPITNVPLEINGKENNMNLIFSQRGSTLENNSRNPVVIHFISNPKPFNTTEDIWKRNLYYYKEYQRTKQLKYSDLVS